MHINYMPIYLYIHLPIFLFYGQQRLNGNEKNTSDNITRIHGTLSRMHSYRRTAALRLQCILACFFIYFSVDFLSFRRIHSETKQICVHMKYLKTILLHLEKSCLFYYTRNGSFRFLDSTSMYGISKIMLFSLQICTATASNWQNQITPSFLFSFYLFLSFWARNKPDLTSWQCLNWSRLLNLPADIGHMENGFNVSRESFVISNNQ